MLGYSPPTAVCYIHLTPALLFDLVELTNVYRTVSIHVSRQPVSNTRRTKLFSPGEWMADRKTVNACVRFKGTPLTAAHSSTSEKPIVSRVGETERPRLEGTPAHGWVEVDGDIALPDLGDLEGWPVFLLGLVFPA